MYHIIYMIKLYHICIYGTSDGILWFLPPRLKCRKLLGWIKIVAPSTSGKSEWLKELSHSVCFKLLRNPLVHDLMEKNIGPVTQCLLKIALLYHERDVSEKLKYHLSSCHWQLLKTGSSIDEPAIIAREARRNASGKTTSFLQILSAHEWLGYAVLLNCCRRTSQLAFFRIFSHLNDSQWDARICACHVLSRPVAEVWRMLF